MSTLARWRESWSRLGGLAASDEVYQSLLESHAEPHRQYHTLQHLTECFARLSELRAAAEHPEEIEIALWFHDAIYKTSRKDNEERSTSLARDSALASGVPGAVAERIAALILMTRHDAVPVSIDAAVMVDCDLGIFAAPRARFDEYERQIREEYSWVQGPLYRNERRKVLRGFTSRQWIYSTELFRRIYETPARENIDRATRAL